MLGTEHRFDSDFASQVRLDSSTDPFEFFLDLAASLVTLCMKHHLTLIDGHLETGRFSALFLQLVHAEAAFFDSPFCVSLRELKVITVQEGIADVEAQLRKDSDHSVAGLQTVIPHLFDVR
jgi:hypothetical protein